MRFEGDSACLTRCESGRVLKKAKFTRFLRIARSRSAEVPTNNIFVRDKNVSRVHCQIVVSNGAVTLTDLQSTNGTFVNNERTTECPLKVNDLIRVGTTLLELEEIDEQGRTITDTAVME